MLRLLGRTSVTGREEPRRRNRHRFAVVKFDDLQSLILGPPDGRGLRSPQAARQRPLTTLPPAAEVDELQLLPGSLPGDGSALPLRRG